MVAHCMSRTGHIRETQNRSFVIQQEGDKRTQDCIFDCCKRYVLFCPLWIPLAYFCNPMCFSSDFEEKQCRTLHGDRFKGTNGSAEMRPSHVPYVTLASGTFERQLSPHRTCGARVLRVTHTGLVQHTSGKLASGREVIMCRVSKKRSWHACCLQQNRCLRT